MKKSSQMSTFVADHYSAKIMQSPSKPRIIEKYEWEETNSCE